MLEDALVILGYKPEDDSWDTDGRRTYISDDDVTPAFLVVVTNILKYINWYRDSSSLRTYRHANGEIIEIEPGGADCTGHYLHHMKAGHNDSISSPSCWRNR